MEFNKESFMEALKKNNIVRYKAYFEAVVKSYLEIESRNSDTKDIVSSLRRENAELKQQIKQMGSAGFDE